MKNKLEDYGGNGFNSCPVLGEFQLKIGDSTVEKFTDLEFFERRYNQINDKEVFAWDLTGVPELIAGKYFQSGHNTESKAIKNRLMELQSIRDKEIAHIEADILLCQLLTKLGYKDIVKEFNKIDKWYS